MTSRGVKLPLGSLRLADVDDAPFIMELANEAMSETFRVYENEDIACLIEDSVLAICQMNPSNLIVGFMALREYPSIPSVDPGAWEEYIWTKYKTTELKPRLTLFLHLLCWHPLYSRELVDNMLRTVFMHDQYIQYVCMVKTDMRYPILMPGQGRAEASFRRIQAMERGVPGDRLPGLYVCDRKGVCPRMRIRRAVEEDNDDIVPIIERHSKRLRALYGDFYISELIARHPESERILLVCEQNELAVGIMCLNTDINFKALEECYDLSPYAGLRRVQDEVEGFKPGSNQSVYSETCLKQPGDSVSSFHLDVLSQERDVKIKQVTIEDYEMEDRRDMEARDSTVPVTDAMYSHFAMLELFDDEEDEVEFDIINIDTELFKLPDLISPSDYILNNNGRQKDQQGDDKYAKKEKKRQMSASYGISRTAERTVRYSGASNAFLLELFALHEDLDERYGFDILEVAFELFPNKDYCVMCLPNCQPAFPLLEHFVLCAPYFSHFKFIHESLYVAHINSVRGEVRVRLGEPADVEHLSDVLENEPKRGALLDLFDATLESPALDTYVLLAQEQPIGLVIIGPLENGTTIRTQYDIRTEPTGQGTDATILAGVMSPALEVHSRWYLREVMRQSGYSTLFWICSPVAKGDASPSRNMMSLAERMVPVRPRQSIPNITGCEELDKFFKKPATPFALWAMERPLSALPKVFINNTIVVVGASRTGLAFLETLIMGPSSKYLTFTNIMLVSEHGLPSVSECLKPAFTCIPREGRYTDQYIKSIPFCFYVDVMPAVMIQIDRNKKCIHFKGGGVKYYDDLVITCGQQFQHPEYMRESLELVKEVKEGKLCERMLMDNPKYQPDKVPAPPEVPDNVMLINTLPQAHMSLRKLLRMISEEKKRLSENKPIVVYGECIEAYCCMAALLELGILPHEILFVEPFPPEDPAALRVNCFNDEEIDERVQEAIENLGIRVLRKTRLMNWQLANGRVTSLRFMSYLKCTTQPCFALFYYGFKGIDLYAFKAINECGLVYDGGLIVGPTFETNDPSIYAAGTCVQYSRRLYADQKLHRYYSSEDVGDALAQLFLEKLDPYIACNDAVTSEITAMVNFGTTPSMLESSSTPKVADGPRGANNPKLSRRWQPVMSFNSPILVVATLPGPLYYMKLRKPGPDIPMEVQLALPHQGHTLQTDFNDNYFRLRLNILHVVNAVTCLSHKQFSPELLTQLYGKHEAYFNQLLLRYQMQQINDLYKYFTMPWLSAVYHDSFKELIAHIDHQEVATIYLLLKSTASLSGKSMANISSDTSCDTLTPQCAVSMHANPNLTSFHSLLTKYVSSLPLMQYKDKRKDIPTECGQSEAVHKQVNKFWEKVDGERIVHAHIANHILRNGVYNPHYAPPDPSFI